MASCELCGLDVKDLVFFRTVPYFGVKHICFECNAAVPAIVARERERLKKVAEEEDASERSVKLTRAQINKGTYDTPEKLSTAIEKCLNTLPKDGSYTTEG